MDITGKFPRSEARTPQSTTAPAPAPKSAEIGPSKTHLSSFEPPQPRRGPDLFDRLQPPPILQSGPATPQQQVGSVPVNPQGNRAPVGEVSYQSGTAYSGNRDLVLSDEPQTLRYNFCASEVFRDIAARVEGWVAGEGEIDAVIREHGTGSSTVVWNQIPGASSDTPVEGQVNIPLSDPPPEITIGTLRFVPTEVQTRNDRGRDNLGGGEVLESLRDLPEGEVRAVVMRPLDNLNNAVGATGHWVLLERTPDGYRLTQSAPQDWALLGGYATNRDAAPQGDPPGGTYVHEFATVEELSAYIHAEAQYSTPDRRYGLVVLEPVVPETTEQVGSSE